MKDVKPEKSVEADTENTYYMYCSSDDGIYWLWGIPQADKLEAKKYAGGGKIVRCFMFEL